MIHIRRSTASLTITADMVLFTLLPLNVPNLVADHQRARSRVRHQLPHGLNLVLQRPLVQHRRDGDDINAPQRQ